MIEIRIETPSGIVKKEYPAGTTIAQIAEDVMIDTKHVIGALANYTIKEMDYQIFSPRIIKFIDASDVNGSRMYARSLLFVLYKSLKDLYPNYRLKVLNTISHGWYCEIEDTVTGNMIFITPEIMSAIKNRMTEIVAEDVPFRRKKLPTEEAMEIFKNHGLHDIIDLINTRGKLYTSVYYLDNEPNYFYGYLIPSTGKLKTWDVITIADGLLVLPPKRSNLDEVSDVINQPKLFKVFRGYKKWVNLMGVPYVSKINEAIDAGKIQFLIKVAETLHEISLTKMAEKILERRPDVKIVLISGPSSSGKTTSSMKLQVHLQAMGVHSHIISLDNYFVNRENTPKDANGNYDFETLDAIDVPFFNQQLHEYLDGKEISLPRFDFKTGTRVFDNVKIQMKPDSLLIIEGIHGLNPNLTPTIADRYKFKIFASALTQVALDYQNVIHTTDNRLIRRIVRDAKYRYYSAYDTLKRWDSVRYGEEKYIFPYQENADFIFNTALLYEISMMKDEAESLLRKVPENQPEYAEAMRLLKFLSFFKSIDQRDIPPTSILREFLGGSSFEY